MNLQKHLLEVRLNDEVISSYMGFLSLKDLVSKVERLTGRSISIHGLQRSDFFLRLVNQYFDLNLSKGDKVASILKSKGLYLCAKGDIFCDYRLFVLFYAASCEEAMIDCIRKGFDL